MKNKAKPKHSHDKKAAPVSKKQRPWWALAAVAVGALAGILYWVTQDGGDEVINTTSTQSSASVPSVAERELLVGRWVRTDSNGAYTLEIRSASDKGNLDVSYFNPNPVNVGRSEWNKEQGSMTVVVELNDVNYPGSTYTLSFSKTNDQLVGSYYQAVQGANYDVAFMRIR